MEVVEVGVGEEEVVEGEGEERIVGEGKVPEQEQADTAQECVQILL